MDKLKPIRINRSDKKLFKKFKTVAFPICDGFAYETIHKYLLDYIKYLLVFRSKGLCVYGYPKIELTQESIDKFLENAKELQALNEKIKQKEFFKKTYFPNCKIFLEAEQYLQLAKEVAEKLNKYVVRHEEPTFMHAMKNYEFMRNTLKSVPFFHDAYIVDCEEKGNDVYVKFGLFASERFFCENKKIYVLNPKYRFKQEKKSGQILITIKFVNASCLEGSYITDWKTHGNMYFLWDLSGEKIDNGKYRFDLGSVQEYVLALACDYIEFVENFSKYDGTYLVPNIERQGSHYYEFQVGNQKNAYWLDSSICIDECGDDDGAVMELLSHFIKDYCQFSFNLIEKKDGEKFVADLQEFNKLIKANVSILKALETMNAYDPTTVKTIAELCAKHNLPPERVSRFEERIAAIDLVKLQKTIDILADWIADTIKHHNAVTLNGI